MSGPTNLKATRRLPLDGIAYEVVTTAPSPSASSPVRSAPTAAPAANEARSAAAGESPLPDAAETAVDSRHDARCVDALFQALSPDCRGAREKLQDLRRPTARSAASEPLMALEAELF